MVEPPRHRPSAKETPLPHFELLMDIEGLSTYIRDTCVYVCASVYKILYIYIYVYIYDLIYTYVYIYMCVYSTYVFFELSMYTRQFASSFPPSAGTA